MFGSQAAAFADYEDAARRLRLFADKKTGFRDTRMRRVWRLLQLFGLVCLIMVVLTHVAETFHLFPKVGWGQPSSIGHYIDLVSAILGCTLLPLGFIGNAVMRRKISN
jgi:formate hydrogenlyase subunit 3/multisubunit Na+/H+ antiporter MnhD subunit